MDILFETWQNKVEVPSRTFIRHRCIDALRSLGREQQMVAWASGKSQEGDSTNKQSQDQDQVDRLMKTLSSFERKIVWYRFYQDLPLAEIAKRSKTDVNRVRETISTALYKMRQTSEDEI